MMIEQLSTWNAAQPLPCIYELNPEKKYVIFADPRTVDIDRLAEAFLSLGNIPDIVIVRVINSNSEIRADLDAKLAAVLK